MPTDPPRDILTITAWVECNDGEPQLRARLLFAPNLAAPSIRQAASTPDGVLQSVQEWLDRLERSGVTWCETDE